MPLHKHPHCDRIVQICVHKGNAITMCSGMLGQSIHTLLPPKASGPHLCNQKDSQSAFSICYNDIIILLTVKQFSVGCGIW